MLRWGVMSKIFSGQSRWVSGCCTVVAPRRGHSPEPPRKTRGVAEDTPPSAGGMSYRGAGMLGHRIRLGAAIASRQGSAEGCWSGSKSPLIFRWLLGKVAQSRIIGSLSAPRCRDTPPLRLALATLYAIDFSFSKAGIKHEPPCFCGAVSKSSRDGRKPSGHVGLGVWWSGARAGDFLPNLVLSCPCLSSSCTPWQRTRALQCDLTPGFQSNPQGNARLGLAGAEGGDMHGTSVSMKVLPCRRHWQRPLEKVHRREKMLPAPGELSACLASSSQQQLQSPFN